MKNRVEELSRRKSMFREMGGQERVDRQHARGKLDARARIERLMDPETFVEVGLLATDGGLLEHEWPRPSPADGVITGTGKIGGRLVAAAAYDFTVYGGSIGEVGERKLTRLRQLALRNRIPMVWLIDSAGARIHRESSFGSADAAIHLSSFADTGYLFREEVAMSGVVPLVAAMMGPGAAGTAYIPGLADFVPMVRGTSSMAIAGPHLVRSVVGETIDEQSLGGSSLHTRISGVADLEVPDDDACLKAVRDYLGFFPSSCHDLPPTIASRPPEGAADDLLAALPDSSRQSYDVRRVLRSILDDGRLFELKPRWAQNICVGLARIGGRPVGVVANNPRYLGGVLDVNASDKAARFINLCDAFRIPLCFFQDVPGFMVGRRVEEQGIIRHGAKMLYAVSAATVPKLTVILRKAYGAGYYVMGGRAFEPDVLVAWPTAEISVMGPEGLASIAGIRELRESDDPVELHKALADALRPHIDVRRAAALGLIDDIIDPRDTRSVLSRGLELTERKTIGATVGGDDEIQAGLNAHRSGSSRTGTSLIDWPSGPAWGREMRFARSAMQPAAARSRDERSS
ncbi:MAG: acyl-CoA carboxylase subunit beta [Myxococcales bacterium]|nr:acyl-CoA carboxylase subunit beta [Myxococcales bacterium]